MKFTIKRILTFLPYLDYVAIHHLVKYNRIKTNCAEIAIKIYINVFLHTFNRLFHEFCLKCPLICTQVQRSMHHSLLAGRVIHLSAGQRSHTHSPRHWFLKQLTIASEFIIITSYQFKHPRPQPIVKSFLNAVLVPFKYPINKNISHSSLLKFTFSHASSFPLFIFFLFLLLIFLLLRNMYGRLIFSFQPNVAICIAMFG